MKNNSNLKPVEILLVEDNSGDIRLTKEALKESKLANNLYTVQDGIEAMDYLNKTEKYQDAVRPDLILLDLNLPKKNGREVLSEIKGNSDFKQIPVVILTSSKAYQDILSTYQNHANCYITKPVNMDQFIEIVKSVGNFWFSIVKLPRKS